MGKCKRCLRLEKTDKKLPAVTLKKVLRGGLGPWPVYNIREVESVENGARFLDLALW
jgi:hypothetical protein